MLEWEIEYGDPAQTFTDALIFDWALPPILAYTLWMARRDKTIRRRKQARVRRWLAQRRPLIEPRTRAQIISIDRTMP